MVREEKKMITCPMCGHQYIPKEHVGCEGCLLKKGCNFSCCPVCGYVDIDINRSNLVKLSNKIFNQFKNKNKDQDISALDPEKKV